MKRQYKHFLLLLLFAVLLCACGGEKDVISSVPASVDEEAISTPEANVNDQLPEGDPAAENEVVTDNVLSVSAKTLANGAACIIVGEELYSLNNYNELAPHAAEILNSGTLRQYDEDEFSARASSLEGTEKLTLSFYDNEHNETFRFVRDEAGIYIEHKKRSLDVRHFYCADAETSEQLDALIEAAYQSIMDAAEPEVPCELVYDDGSVYPLAVPLGTSVMTDLNGDGAAERLYQNSGGPGGKNFFSINGVDMSYAIKDLGIYISWLSPQNYYITDLDTSDGMLEISIYDEGPSGDPEIHFLRFAGGELSYLGSIPDAFENLEFDAKGGVDGIFRLPISHTWWGEGRWELTESGLLEQMPQEFYYSTGDIVFYRGENGEELSHHPLAGEVYAYESMSLDSVCSVLGTADEITLLGTDLKEWLLVETGTGIRYWLHLTEGYLDTPDGPKSTMDIIMYLYIAG